MDVDTLANILARLTTLTENQAQNNAQPAAPPAPATPRVRAINCKTFCIGQDWGTYSDYLRENIRAAYNLANGDKDPLDAACCSWVGSKLEPGPTLTVYQSLADDIKNNWDRLNDELADLYVDEEQRQLFLANPGAFKKGAQTWVAYKNELVRRVNKYQPTLKNVDTEFQRQLVERFIAGIEDAKLQRKLRRHCRRDKLNIEAAFEYAVDYESTELEEKGKELAAAARMQPFAAASHPPPFAAAAAAAVEGANPSSVRILERSIDPNIQANRLAIEQLKAGQAELNDRVDIMKKEMTEGFKNLEFLITATHEINRQQTQTTPAALAQQQPQHTQPQQTQHQPQQQQQQSYRQPFQQRYGPSPFRNGRRIVPGLSGGPGFQVPNNQQFRSRMPQNGQAPHAPNVASAPPANELGAAAAPPPQPQSEILHPRADPDQNTYAHRSIWGEHLEYEPAPMNYAAFGAASGNYSYYPPDFQ